MLQAPTDWLQGLRPWRGPGGQSPGLTSLPGFSGPETDMRSVLDGVGELLRDHADRPNGPHPVSRGPWRNIGTLECFRKTVISLHVTLHCEPD
jgi:hypothetical protein